MRERLQVYLQTNAASTSGLNRENTKANLMQRSLLNRYFFAFLLFSIVGLIILGQQLLAHASRNVGLDGNWEEVVWPFPLDGWPSGRAFSCEPSKCQSEISIFIRPKIGFCNCDRGVSDDDEIDRVGDLMLIDKSYIPASAGVSVTINGMAGRARRFRTTSRPLEIIGIALARTCDSVVVTAVSDSKISELGEKIIFELLDSTQIKVWIETFPQS